MRPLDMEAMIQKISPFQLHYHLSLTCFSAVRLLPIPAFVQVHMKYNRIAIFNISHNKSRTIWLKNSIPTSGVIVITGISGQSIAHPSEDITNTINPFQFKSPARCRITKECTSALN